MGKTKRTRYSADFKARVAREAMKEDDSGKKDDARLEDQGSGNVIEGEVTSKKQDKA